MYAKCGDLSVSRNAIHMMPIKDVVAWSTMIFANVMHGNGKEALFLLEKMLLSRVKPIYVNFTCSHSRLEEKGVQILNLMSRDHLVESDVKHYSCVVAVLVTSTRHAFIQRMPLEPTACSCENFSKETI
jgi:hypothetical protein